MNSPELQAVKKERDAFLLSLGASDPLLAKAFKGAADYLINCYKQRMKEMTSPASTPEMPVRSGVPKQAD